MMSLTLWFRTLRRAAALAVITLAMPAAAGAESERAAAKERPKADQPRGEQPAKDRERPVQRAEPRRDASDRKSQREELAPQLRRLQELNRQIQEARQDFRAAVLEGRSEAELRKRADRLAELETERRLLQAQAVRKFRDQARPALRQWLRRGRGGAAGLAPGRWAWATPGWRAGRWGPSVPGWWSPPWMGRPEPPPGWVAPKYPRLLKRDLQPTAPDKSLKPKDKARPKDKPKAAPEQKPSKPAKRADKKPKAKA